MANEYFYEMYKDFHYDKEFKVNLKKNRPDIFNKEEIKVIELFEELYSLEFNKLSELKYNIRYCKDYVKLMLAYPECFVIKNEMLRKIEPSNKEFKVLDTLKNINIDRNYKKDILKFRGKLDQKLRYRLERDCDIQMDMKFRNTKNVKRILLEIGPMLNSIYENKEKLDLIEIKEVISQGCLGGADTMFIFEFYNQDISGDNIDFECNNIYLLQDLRRYIINNSIIIPNKNKEELFYFKVVPDSIENYKEKGLVIKLPDYIEEYNEEYRKYIYLGNQNEIHGMIFLVLGKDDYRLELNDPGKVGLICKPSLNDRFKDHLKKTQGIYTYINKLRGIILDKELPRPVKIKHYLPEKYKEFFKREVYYYHLDKNIDYVFYPEMYYLKKEIHEEIETHFKYRPGGAGYHEAKEHFNKLQNENVI